MLFVNCFLKEAEANHPELLALPDDIEMCDKAAGYKNLSDLHWVIVFLFTWSSVDL